jgi:hypothetical protein
MAVMKIRFPRLAQILSLSLILIASRFALLAVETPDTGRIRDIAAMLSEPAAGFGLPITNRTAWSNAAALHPELRDLIPSAVKLAAQPLPEQPDSLFLEYSRNGNRDHWQTVASSRRDRIQIFTLAECVENQGHFLVPLEQAIAALCAEQTWVLPAHDGDLKNFHGEAIDIDLGAASVGVELATAAYLLGDRLPSATRQLIRQNLERRIFVPYRAAVNGTGKKFWWMGGANNWNAVCLDGVTGAALATLDSPADRAWFIAVAEKDIGGYLAGGFTPDGYCVEGLGYWNYGFGSFVLLAENIRQATVGKIDLLAEPQAVPPALFGLRSEISNGVYPTIADVHPGEKPSGILMNYLSRRFNLDNTRWRDTRLTGRLHEKTAMAFLPAEMPQIQSSNNPAALPWRTWFPDGGVLICRPGTGATAPFAAAIKGGNNGVSHGHNDVGSFSVVAGRTMVLCDPGGEVYTARTFGAHRFDSKVLNSFGHMVPVVAGQLQRTGADARGLILETNFTTAADTLRLDLRSAYAGPHLQKLERTFVFQRGETPSLEVRDEVAFSTPEQFETALVTWGTVKAAGDSTLEIADGDSAVRVTIDTQGREFKWHHEIIEEDVQATRKPVRIGIQLISKISSGVITLKISPVGI